MARDTAGLAAATARRLGTDPATKAGAVKARRFMPSASLAAAGCWGTFSWSAMMAGDQRPLPITAEARGCTMRFALSCRCPAAPAQCVPQLPITTAGRSRDRQFQGQPTGGEPQPFFMYRLQSGSAGWPPRPGCADRMVPGGCSALSAVHPILRTKPAFNAFRQH